MYVATLQRAQQSFFTSGQACQYSERYEWGLNGMGPLDDWLQTRGPVHPAEVPV